MSRRKADRIGFIEDYFQQRADASILRLELTDLMVPRPQSGGRPQANSWLL